MAVSLNFTCKAGNGREHSDKHIGGLGGTASQKEVQRKFADIVHYAIARIEGMDSAQLNTDYTAVANNNAGVFTLTLTPSATTNKQAFNN